MAVIGDIKRKIKFLTEQEKTSPGFTKEQLNTKAAEDIKKFLQRKDVQQAIANSKVVTGLNEVAIDVIIKRAQKIAAFTTYDDFKKYMGNDFSKFEKQVMQAISKNASSEKLEEVKTKLVPEFKTEYGKIYKLQLEKIRNAASNSGNKNLETKAANAISQINSILS